MAKGAFVKSLIEIAERNIDKAKKAGFDTETSWYHGSGAQHIPEINMAEYGGKATDTPASKEAFFLVNNPEAAEGFAKNAAGDSGKVHEFFYRPDGKTVTIDWADYAGGLSARSSNGQRYLAGLLADMKEQGATGVLLKNMDDAATEGGKVGDVLAVLDETALRYPNAKFENLGSRGTMAGIAGAIGAGTMLGGAEDTQAAPQGRFAKSLMEAYTRQKIGKPMSPDERLQYGQGFSQQDTIQAPENEMMARAADIASKYNTWRKENFHPVMDLILPVGELPAEYYNKLAYGDKTTTKDKVKAALGLL